MFDRTRLNPKRVIPAIIRRLREIPHYIAWRYSAMGRDNRKKLLSFKNKYSGETLFLLANGPSINKTDLSLLKGKNVMCMNRFYIKFPQLDFKPNYLVCIEETVLDRFSEDFSNLQIPGFVNWRLRNKISNVVYLKESFDIQFKFQPDITLPANTGGTVTFVCLQLAYFMGFSKVVILGMDHSFKETGLAGKAEIRTQDKDESHFDPNYFPKGMKWVLPDLVKSELGYAIARDFYKKNGREVIDATIEGKCNIFTKGKLEDYVS
ncbi:6-hydroxymethylpterin diphosphokinase MptE-like protein [Flavobacterium akiainvivens]|uniref:6-hydroxymethylpterin diphosphokinase MptE-like protein n=1 Tax=Flavobacterium akiainvivens TaxID=1202724 RepID=UPI0006C87DE7|nr:6-hydroxymethylpterin diphosphokinase MptE-like protein [Flavobacterium akiainvivens]SFQ15186.1 Protein of unknown function DUF115 [Flavobacterium akiainvivens]